ncbi:MAG: type VI secretion system protein TssA [Pseudomonadota bacterium]|nr:type VI secretion system protein TssA [Pseudomonadota bacterium]
MTLPSVEEITQLATAAIAEAEPAGRNVRLEPVFEAIEQELAKLESVTVAEPVRWDQVAAGCRQILQRESKDFLVAVFLARAWCEQHPVTGLTRGLQLIEQLAESFWQQAFPPTQRLRGRARAVDWLVDQCHPLLEQCQPRDVDASALQALEQSLGRLDQLLLERMTEQAPNLAEIRHTVKRLSEGLQAQHSAVKAAAGSHAPAQPPPVSGRTATAAVQAGTAAASAPVPVSGDKELMAVYRQSQAQLRYASLYLLEQDPLQPEPFRINRFITWLGVTTLPPATEQRTQLRPVARDKLDGFQRLQQEQRWRELVLTLEPSLVQAPFWLTGQRQLHEALTALGAEAAAQVVAAGVKEFVRRLPGVEQLSFSDGSAFADAATVQWIKNLEREPSAAAADTRIQVDTTEVSPEWERSYADAEALADQQELRQALALFQQGVARSVSLREQALWRFNQARFCFERGLWQLAMPLLESLDRQLHDLGVQDWEPQMTKRVLELQLRCLQQQNDAAEAQPRTAQIHARLCRLDLALAYDLTPSNAVNQ